MVKCITNTNILTILINFNSYQNETNNYFSTKQCEYNVSTFDIHTACTEFAGVLELPNLKINILEEGDIEIKPANEIVTPIIDKIAQMCNHPNDLVTVANFWKLISTAEINKGMLQKLVAHRNATKAYLKQKKLDCFLALFDDALKRM